MTAPQTNRPPRPQVVLTVLDRDWLTPHLVRITAGGAGFGEFTTNGYTDKYVKIRFTDPTDQMPVTRTYTVRKVDADDQTVAIDFVVHGTEGIAGPWAAGAQPGDTITFSGPGGAYGPDTENDWHLFIGDESGLPAISSALEALPSDARGIAYLESHGDDEDVDVVAPVGVKIVRVHRAEPGTAPHLLAETVERGEWLPGRVGVFAHGERESMKAVRAALKNRDLGGGSLSISGYWAYGRSEDKFQAEKREPIGKIEA
jgi:NADPH-dependent ferric siderophore reductase